MTENPIASVPRISCIALWVSLLCALVTYSVAIADPIQRSEIFVKDGDTIIKAPPNEKHNKDQEYRLVGFDTPETARGKCPYEIDLGNIATARLLALLETGPIDLTSIDCTCPDPKKVCNFGRQCGKLTVNGKDVGEILIAENLAVPFDCITNGRCPKQQSWCGPKPKQKRR